MNNLLCLPPETIWLEPEHFQQAVEISSQVASEPTRWQVYLQALALLGFEEWWHSRWADIPLSRKDCSLFEPRYATAIAAVCNLLAGKFKLCLIAIESPLSDVIVLPRAVIDLPEFTAHFYIIVEVQEEQEQVIIQGFLRHDQLISYRQLINLKPTSDCDFNYHLPLSLFEVEVNRLVFNLRFLAEGAINLPVASVNNSPTLTENQLLALLTQTSVNVAKWLQGEIDEVAQSLGIFLPQAKASALRLSVDKLEGAIIKLKNLGMKIPDSATHVFQKINLGGIHLLLCAVAWPINGELAYLQKWSLLLILGTELGDPLPNNLKLQISNISGLLLESVSKFGKPFLYVRAEGKWHEKLLVTIMLPDKPALVLNSYTFDNTQYL